MLMRQLSGAVRKGGWGDAVRRRRNQFSCEFDPRANGMHRFEGAAERVGERAKQFQPLGVDAGLGFAAEALIAVKSKPDRLRCNGDCVCRIHGVPWQEQAEAACLLLARPCRSSSSLPKAMDIKCLKRAHAYQHEG